MDMDQLRKINTLSHELKRHHMADSSTDAYSQAQQIVQIIPKHKPAESGETVLVEAAPAPLAERQFQIELDRVHKAVAEELEMMRGAINQIQDAVREGSSIAAALGASGQFPAFVSNMVAVGEESGTVDAALLKVASTYEREVDRTIRTLTTILEPVLLVIVGGIVMLIVLAMLLPVFQIGLVVQ